MDKKDVLVSDMRVTVLAPGEPYDFEWVDKEDKIVTLTKNCKYSTVPKNVENVVRQNNISIVDEDLESNNQQNDDSNLIGESTNSTSSTNFSTTESVSESDESNLLGEPTKDEESIDGEYISFIVRMDNPEDREDIVNQLKDSNLKASNKLQLTGPYRVYYKIKSNSIELVGMEDMGIGSEAGNTDV